MEVTTYTADLIGGNLTVSWNGTWPKDHGIREEDLGNFTEKYQGLICLLEHKALFKVGTILS